MRPRQAWIIVGTVLVALLAPGFVVAQEETLKFKNQKIVSVDTGTGEVLLPDATGTPINQHRGPSEDEVPVPFFPVPKPESTGAVDTYRTIDLIETILGQQGSLLPDGKVRGVPFPEPSNPDNRILVISPRAILGTADGTSTKRGAGAIADRPILRVSVAAPALPEQQNEDYRPDGTNKGVAVFVGGDPREWMASEAVLRFFQRFQAADDYEAIQSNLWQQKQAGVDEQFFAENVRFFFLPLPTPTALQVTQQDFDSCYRITESATPGTETSVGCLRHGRFRRKNLNGVSDSRILSPGRRGRFSTVAFNSFLGVNIDRQMAEDAFKLRRDDAYGEPQSTEFRGNHSRSEAESRAIEKLAINAFTDGALDRPKRMTGAAFLDVHSSGATTTLVAPSDGPFGQYATGLSNFIKRGEPSLLGPLLEDSTEVRPGTALRFMLDRKVPGATFSLDPSFEFTNFKVSSGFFQPFPGGTTYPAKTKESLLHIVPAGGEYRTRRGYTGTAIEGALHWAAGPPYVRQILLLQKKIGSAVADVNKYDRNALDDKSEVIFDGGWDVDLSDAGRNKRMKVDGAVVPPGKHRWGNRTNQYTLAIMFSKPMRRSPRADDATDQAQQTAPPIVKVVDAKGNELKVGISTTDGAWRFNDTFGVNALTMGLKPTDPVVGPVGVKRYDYDTWVLTFRFPNGITILGDIPQPAKFHVEAKDRVGLQLDANPMTVAGWQDGAFADYELGADETQGGFSVDSFAPVFRKLPAPPPK